MSRDKDPTVEQHFHVAIALGTAQREAYVSNLATVSPEDAAELRSLLEHASGDALSGSFDSLQSLASELGIGRVAVGQQIGEYRLVEMIGEGGSGRVFRAMQRSPEREVALKVLRTGLDEARGQVLFEVEAATLARLGHPSIAHVYASGVLELEGRSVPWFAMELVQGGVPFTAYAEAKGLSLEGRVNLLATVAEGVAYAHGRGVFHLDLKPGNILVDRQGAAKVIDFGIAQHGQVQEVSGGPVGTPGHMSPEQREGGAVDARSDVWALGVLLSGQIDLAEASRSRELDAVIQRALHSDPDRRYRDAAAFAEDLRNWRSRRPVRALPQSPLYVARCFVRRNPLASAALVLLGLALAAGFLSTAWGLSEAERSRADSEWGVSFFRSWLEDADPLRGSGPEATFGSALVRASAQLDANPPPPALEADLRHSLGVALQDAGRPQDAARHLERALELRIQEDGGVADAALETELELAFVYHALGEFRSAYEHSRHVADQRAARLGANHRATLASEMAALRAASALNELGADALAQTQAFVERCVEHLGPEDDATITARQNLGVALHETGRLKAAAAQFRIVADWRSRTLGEDDLRTHMARRDLGSMLLGLGQSEEATLVLERAANGLNFSLGEHHPVTLAALANLAVAMRHSGKLDAAIELTARVAQDRTRVLGPRHQHTVETVLNLATALLEAAQEAVAAGDDDRAGQLRTRADMRIVQLEEQRSLLSLRARTALDVNIGKSRAAEGRWDEAAASFGRARATSAGGEGTWLDAYLEGRYVHARCFAEGRGDLDQATRANIERCVQTLIRLRGPGDRYAAALTELLSD